MKRVRLTVLVLAVVSAATIGFAYWWSSRPAVSKITVDPAAAQDDALRVKSNHYSGEYVGFEYSGIYEVDSSPSADKRIVELHGWQSARQPLKQLSVSITKLPSMMLTDDASYNLRKTYPDQWKEAIYPVNKDEAHIMTKVQEAETVAFLPHRGMLATIVLLSDKPNDDIQSELHALLDSLVWHEDAIL